MSSILKVYKDLLKKYVHLSMENQGLLEIPEDESLHPIQEIENFSSDEQFILNEIKNELIKEHQLLAGH